MSRTKIIIIMSLLTAFACGRYSVNTKPNTASSSTVNTDTRETDSKNSQTHTTITTTKAPTGEVKTVTIIDTATSDKITEQQTQTIKDLQTIVSANRSTLNVSALVANEFTDGLKPTYGVSVTKQVIGPVTVGAFLLTNSTVGLSLGLNF